MPQSTRLTSDQIRVAMRTVGDCRDVGLDPAAWNLRVSCFFQEHLRSVFTTGFTLRIEDCQSKIQQLHFAFWSDNRMHTRWVKFGADHGYRNYLSVQRFSERYAGQGMTVTRQDLIANREWFDSPERIDRVTARQDELMISAQPYERGLIHAFSINRAVGDTPFTVADKALVRLIHEELGLLFGTRLSLNLDSQALPADLSPRLQAVLICLLAGDSDKEMANRICLSVHTVHEYVKQLYCRFGVHSRAELFAIAHRSEWHPAKLT